MKAPKKRTAGRSQRVEMEFLEAVRARRPENRLVTESLGDLYTATGRYEEGLKIDLELARQYPDDAYVLYNLGCSYALVGQKEKAMEILSKAVDQGYSESRWMTQDSDLESLRDDPRFKQLVKRAGEKKPRNILDSIQKELF